MWPFSLRGADSAELTILQAAVTTWEPSSQATPVMSVEFIFFFLFALGALVTSILVVSMRNPISSAISLVGTFLCMAGLYALLHAPFMAVIQVMVYAGAIMVLFVFVIMLLNLQDDELGEGRFTITKIFSAVVGIAVMAIFVGAFGSLQVAPDVVVSQAQAGKTVAEVMAEGELPFKAKDVLVDGKELLDPNTKLEEGQVVVIKTTRFRGLDRVVATPTDADARFVAGLDEDGQPLAGDKKVLAKQQAQVKSRLKLWERFGSIEAVGERLYTKWLFPFEITALLLLAAIAGAVVMAKRRL